MIMEAQITHIHAAPERLVLAFAGAGSLGLAWLHAVAGSSRTILEAVDCYAPRALAEIVGAPVQQAVSAGTAHAMAAWALRRAHILADGDWPLLGVGLTAAIQTDRVRRGADRGFIAIHSAHAQQLHPISLEESGDRQAQEIAISTALIRAIAAACVMGADC
jgi:nicotinamide mononucleotide (NMN) deamidase PncC